MKAISSRFVLFSIMFFVFNCGNTGKKDYPIEPVPFTKVQMNDEFWAPRLETNRTVTIPFVFQKCEETGRIDNFAIAGGLKEGEHRGSYPFDDTDVYKNIEAASYSLMVHYDQELDNYLDDLITLIGAAQEDDGYLYTARTNNAERLKNWFGDERYEKLDGSHELYNPGHLYEAAAAHFQATGKRNLLDIAVKNADMIAREFGPGKLQKPPGHQVIEMGLVKLYRVTGDEKYLDLAKYFLDIRGKALDGRELRGTYNQDHMPVIEQEKAVGHAVRAVYMYAGMADVAALTENADYINAIDRIWNNVSGKRLYITGGIGSTGSGEGFSTDYDLPNMSAYNETCASIGNVYWNHRMFLLHGDAKYIDVMERTLYNALIDGISLEGNLFFYPNPLESVGQHQRSPWFNCACCTGNVTRFVSSVPGYVYAVKDDELYVNLYAGGEGEIDVDGEKVKIIQETRYPWEGGIKIRIEPENGNKKFTLLLRIPGWALDNPVPGDLYSFIDNKHEKISFSLNNEPLDLNISKGYAGISRNWKSGDMVELDLPMAVRRIAAHDSVKADIGKVALQRGPIVFCAEWPDNEGGHVRNLLLTNDTDLQTDFRSGLLNGVQVVTGKVYGYKVGSDHRTLEREEQDITMIPYFAWAHRGNGEMSVWLARNESAVRPLKMPTIASGSTVRASFGRNPEAVNDQLEPTSSGDHDVPFFHWWPHKGTTEWIQYRFLKPEEVSTVEVYWFDDTGRGECRIPDSWRILYRDGREWKPVYTTETYGVEKDRWNRVVFETVRTRSIRLEINSKEGFAGGIHELRIK
ncbi:beta-L-arabinofuranosidase domain-containing protein [candidate division KSB1 bacterium]